MSIVRGCLLPEDLYYLLEKHVWVRPEDGVARIGITPAGFKLAGGRPVAITIQARKIGQEVQAGRAIAVLESAKWAGGVPAPFIGTLVAGNEALAANPGLAVDDPYGRGWIAEMRYDDWALAQAGLVTGQAAMAAFQALFEAKGIRCGEGQDQIPRHTYK